MVCEQADLSRHSPALVSDATSAYMKAVQPYQARIKQPYGTKAAISVVNNVLALAECDVLFLTLPSATSAPVADEVVYSYCQNVCCAVAILR